MRTGPLDQTTKDQRKISQRRLRKSSLLPLQKESNDNEELYYHEAQISSLCWGTDEWFWTELFLVETYFGSEEHLLNYLSSSEDAKRVDPPLAGGCEMKNPCFDPREYWLWQLRLRFEQITEEYTALIETFNKRMEAYIFVDSISGILDAWAAFRKDQIAFFTTYAHNKTEYPKHLESIFRSIGELSRLRSLLLTHRGRFKSKLENSQPDRDGNSSGREYPDTHPNDRRKPTSSNTAKSKNPKLMMPA
ncbi:hypothetical protein N0V90_003934 [Kalmusia sp. IMI 367209]|nr:hypothetical protein N0V90_003934 [Kalmusia sp. IMI 367209]